MQPQNFNSVSTDSRGPHSEARPGPSLQLTSEFDRRQTKGKHVSFPETVVDHSREALEIHEINEDSHAFHERLSVELCASPVESSPVKSPDHGSRGIPSTYSSPTDVGRDDLNSRLNRALVKSAFGMSVVHSQSSSLTNHCVRIRSTQVFSSGK